MKTLILLSAVTASDAIFPWFDASLPRHKRVQQLIDAMSVKEKINQLVTDTPRIPRLGIPAYHWRNNVLHGLVDNGLSTQFPQAIAMAATFSSDLLYYAGRVMANEQRAKHNTQHQHAARQITNNSSGFPDSAMDYGLDLWGPNINMFRDPRWGRGQETYGEDPYLTSTLARAFVRGLQNGPQQNVGKFKERLYETIATCKHFSAYTVEEKRLSSYMQVKDVDWWQYYFPAWEGCAEEAVSVMCSYNGVNDKPMCANKHLLNGVLSSDDRTQHGLDFRKKAENYIVSDTGAIGFMVSDFHLFNHTVDAAIAAINAGVDLNSGTEYRKLIRAISQDHRKDIAITTVDRALTRVLHARMALGLFEDPRSITYSALGDTDVFTEANQRVSYNVAVRSLVLLKNSAKNVRTGSQDSEYNEGRSMLPLGKEVTKIALIGWGANDTEAPLANYAGCGFSAWGPRIPDCHIVTPLQGIRERFEKDHVSVVYARGSDVEHTDTSGYEEALALARAADVIIYVGGNRNCEGGPGKGGRHCESESHDRPDLDLPVVQTNLIKKLYEINRNIVFAVITGSPISFNWEAEHLPAIVVMWYAGQQGGRALAAVLSGDVSPSGKTPVTWPTGLHQLPDKFDMSPSSPPGRGYRYLTEMPLYFFGYGLTYGKTTFHIETINGKKPTSPLRMGRSEAKTLPICVLVRNTGTRKTEEVVQVYAEPDAAVRARAESAPTFLLVGFARTPHPIAPKSNQRICIKISMRSLRLMAAPSNNTKKSAHQHRVGVNRAEDFHVLPGTYYIHVGGASPHKGQGLFVDEGAVSLHARATVEIMDSAVLKETIIMW